MRVRLCRAPGYLGVVLAGIMGLLAPGCSSPAEGIGDCNDGIDNDEDGLNDSQDPGCQLSGGAGESPDPVACNDGVDNDRDGRIDFPDDPGCLRETDEDEYNEYRPQCSDSTDNDGDGLTDYPFDPGCFLPLEDDESDDCPNGMACPQCSNGVDDDGDGLIDLDSDPGCESAADFDEYDLVAAACGGDLAVRLLPEDTLEALGSASAGRESFLSSPECGGEGSEYAYALRVLRPSKVKITTDFLQTTTDTVIYLRKGCLEPETELACNDNRRAGVTSSEMLLEVTEPGVYYLIVDTANAGDTGGFKVGVKFYSLAGDPCDPMAPNCAPGDSCRPLDGNTAEYACWSPVCSDLHDNDGDGFIDYPRDPGCANPADMDEQDDCPIGPDCSLCSNGRDDDGDGYIDFGGDFGCESANDNAEEDECIPGVFLPLLTNAGDRGITPPSSVGSRFQGSCDINTRTAAELVYRYQLEQPLRELRFSTQGSGGDTVTYVRTGACGDGGVEVACSQLEVGGEQVRIPNATPGDYFVFVDGDGVSGIAYTVAVSGVIGNGQACDPATSDQFACDNGYACNPDTRVCEPAICANGIDDDGDGLVDYPFDPGCATISDSDEADDCPTGPECAACSNQRDDENDGSTDYPTDIGCDAAGDRDERGCAVERDPEVLLTAARTTGTTTGRNNDHTPSCRSTSTSPDLTYILSVPGRLSSLTVDTNGSSYDTVLMVREASCTNADLACDDDSGDGTQSLVTLRDVFPGRYYVVVDGYGGSSAGSVVLNVRGELAPGESCDPNQPMFSCASGYGCSSATRTCEPALCDDSVDNDGDGLTDYPADPGCSSRNDADEDDTCPSGTDCPACSNDRDDDNDGETDFGGDIGCESAGDQAEANECIPGVTMQRLTLAGASGSTPPSSVGSRFRGSCNTSTTSTESVFGFLLTRPLKELRFSTVGSTGDTVTYVRYGSCGDTTAEVACAQVDASGETATISQPALGNYYVFVDGDAVSGISYVLNVSGVIASGDSCDPSDTTRFVCESGHVCSSDSSTCVPAVCSNTVDDDGDGLIDYPQDPGCSTREDRDETDDCPAGTGCPACGNDRDDDGDGDSDYGTDIGCSAAGDTSEADECIAGVAMQRLPYAGASGTTPPSTAGSRFRGSCNTSTNSTESVFYFKLDRPMRELRFSTEGSVGDTVTYVRYGTCGDTTSEVACSQINNGGESVTLTQPPEGDYFVFVDGDFVSNISYVLNVSGVIDAGDPCDPALASQFTCIDGYSCSATTLRCEPAACSNNLDDDGDGRSDYPSDPGCTSTSDGAEADDCPAGILCSECANGVDDDGDGRTDYPNEPGCTSASDDMEAQTCITSVPLELLTEAGVTGTTPLPGTPARFTGSCTTATSATEMVYQYRLRYTLRELRFSTVGSAGDTALYVRYGMCGNRQAEVACNQVNGGGEETVITNPQTGYYYVFVDGNFVSGISYALNVSGVIVGGTACDPDSTRLVCEDGYYCDGTTRTCEVDQCSNGTDDDGDGLIDYPFDPGCTAADDSYELDTCPSGADCPACGNQVDDDADGDIDFGSDFGCQNASDRSEIDECIPGVALARLTAAGDTSTTPAATVGSRFSGSCSAGTATRTESLYRFPLDRDLSELTFSTVGSTGDTVTYVRYGQCADAANEIACRNDAGGGERITLDSPAQGEYFVFVDGASASRISYRIAVSGVVSPGGACNPMETAFVCSDGYICDGLSFTCEPTMCNNGIDDDGDGQIDFPQDPGCVSIVDDDELDSCPDGATCPECGNGADDDGDGQIDFPSDPGCQAASDDLEVDYCIAGVDLRLLTEERVLGTTPPASAGSRFQPSCSTSTTATEEVYAFRLDQPMRSLSFSTVGSAGDTVLSVRYAACGDTAAEVACNQVDGGGESVAIAEAQPGYYYVFVDGDNVSGIAYALQASGQVPGGGTCDPASTRFTCETGYYCNDASRTCELLLCSNGIDDDGDGAIDYPNDPGCASPADNDELDDCPAGPGCPACSNGVDDDGDGDIDVGADFGCDAASDPSEIDECIPGVVLARLTDIGDTGTTPPASVGSRFRSSCSTSTTATEAVYRYPLDRMLSELTFSTDGSVGDTVLSVRSGQCGDAADELECRDVTGGGEDLTLYSPAMGDYFVFVDGANASAIGYAVVAYGVVAPGGACDPRSNQFVCEDGYVCDGVSFTCVATVCNNGADDDGDGLIDFPLDPGCTLAGDGDEADDCPAGSGCAACSNGVDDDLDGATDYPDDVDCDAASSTSEVACVLETDATQLISAPVTMGTTAGASNSFTPSCSAGSTAPDRLLELRVPGDLRRLSLDTVGSAYDTVLMLYGAECTADELVCNDNGSGSSSRLSLAYVPAGTYLVAVDGAGAASDGFTLNVSGEIGAGQRCDPAQVASGLFACAASTACTDQGTGFRCQ